MKKDFAFSRRCPEPTLPAAGATGKAGPPSAEQNSGPCFSFVKRPPALPINLLNLYAENAGERPTEASDELAPAASSRMETDEYAGGTRDAAPGIHNQQPGKAQGDERRGIAQGNPPIPDPSNQVKM